MKNSARRTFLRGTLAAAAIFALACLPAAVQPPRVSEGAPDRVIVGGTIIDGTGAPPRANGYLLVREGRIVEAAPPGLPVPPGSRIDASGLYVVPGIVNAHAHVLRRGGCRVDEPPAPGVVLRNWRTALRRGITTVGDQATSFALIRAARRWLAAHPGSAPHIEWAGPVLTGPGGYPLDWFPEAAKKLDVAVGLRSADEAGAIVRKVHALGLRYVKVAIQERSYALHPIPQISDEALRGVVDEAHALGLRVGVHAISLEGYERGVSAGVDQFVHGPMEILPDGLIAEIVRKHILVVPTFWVWEQAVYGPEHPEMIDRLAPIVGPSLEEDLREYAAAYKTSGEFLPPSLLIPGIPKERGRTGFADLASNVRRMKAAGVRIAFGTDAPYCFDAFADPVEEMVRMHAAGLTPLEVVTAAGKHSAEVLGIEKDRGTLEAGKRADLLLLEKNPLEDLRAYEHVRLTLLDGTPVADRPAEAPAAEVVGFTAAILGAVRPLLPSGPSEKEF